MTINKFNKQCELYHSLSLSNRVKVQKFFFKISKSLYMSSYLKKKKIVCKVDLSSLFTIIFFRREKPLNTLLTILEFMSDLLTTE